MFNKKGQSTLEYALVIAIIIAGLLLMQHYVRRGYAGRLRSASDDMGEQYDPTVSTSNYNIVQHSKVQSTVDAGTKAAVQIHRDDQTSDRTGSETLGAWGATEDLYTR